MAAAWPWIHAYVRHLYASRSRTAGAGFMIDHDCAIDKPKKKKKKKKKKKMHAQEREKTKIINKSAPLSLMVIDNYILRY